MSLKKRKAEQLDEQIDPSILRMLEDTPEIEELTEAKLKKMILTLERKYQHNLKLRISFPDEPSKFLESEVDLDEELKRLTVVATRPDLFGVLVRTDALRSLLSLVEHPNVDISGDAVALLKELTDADDGDDESDEDEDEDSENEEALLEKRRQKNAPQLQLIDRAAELAAFRVLADNLARLNPRVQEEADIIHNTLAVFENVVEINAKLAGQAAESSSLVAYLLRALNPVPVSGGTAAAAAAKGGTSRRGGVDADDDIRLYAGELLSVYLQASEQVVEHVLAKQGQAAVEALLTVLHGFRKHAHLGVEEEELVENVFDALCLLVAKDSQRDNLFYALEGPSLLFVLITHKHAAMANFFLPRCVRVLNYFLQRHPQNCAAFVGELLGLKYLCAALMKSLDGGRTARKGGRKQQAVLDEHSLSCLASLFHYLENTHTSEAPFPVLRLRLFAKFVEGDFIKTERIVELRTIYAEKLALEDAAIARERQDDNDNDSDNDGMLLRRLDAGLFTVQMCDVVLAYLLTAHHHAPAVDEFAALRDRAVELLEQNNASVAAVRATVAEMEAAYDKGSSEYTLLAALLANLPPQ